MCNFNHLHVHTEYSLLDGGSKIEDLISTAKGLGQSAIAITDHGNMTGVVEFFREAKKNDIKPIIGCELYQFRYGTTKNDKNASNRTPRHLLALAENNVGYKNLIKLSTLGYTEGFYYKPRVDYDMIEQYKDGLIYTTGCMAAEIPYLIGNGGDDSLIKSIMGWWVESFGENFYVELQHHPGIPELASINLKLIELSKYFGTKIIITNDAHYATQDNAIPHDLLLCVQTRKKFSDEDRMRFSDPEYYLKSEEEIRQDFSQYADFNESWITNTAEIAERCNVELETNREFIPDVEIAPIYKDYDDALESMAKQNIHNFYPEITKEIKDRVEYELDIIKQTGYSSYYLIIKDLLDFARQNNIIFNCRGSGAGSIVSYVLGLSFIDPIKYDLVFERFINPERVTMPDFDMDFPDSERENLINYIISKYGKDQVAQVITIGRMKARMIIRDVGRVIGWQQEDIDRLAKMVLNVPGKPITIEGSLDKNNEWFSPDLKEEYESSEEAKSLLDVAQKLEGLARHSGVHAAAVIIGTERLDNLVPLQNGTKTSITETITQFEYPILESLGLLKIDILGLSTLSVIQKTLDLIEESRGTKYRYEDIPYEDSAVFEILSSGETQGIFQVESHGLTRILKRLKPYKFEQIADVISLYRPGPLQYIDSYIDRSHGNEKVKYIDPLVENILEETQGIMIYQEQVMRVLQVLGGFTLGEADLIRKGMGKKKEEIVKKGRESFVGGAKRLHGIDESKANKIYNDIMHFAGYGFNHCVPYDTLIKKASSNQYDPLSVGEMYYARNDSEWARNNGKSDIGKKYRLNGYGYGLSMFSDERVRPNIIVDIRHAGYKECFEIETESGKTIQATANHKFPTPSGITKLENLSVGDYLYVQGEYEKTSKNYGFGGKSNVPKKGQQGFQTTNGPSVQFFETRNLMIENLSPCEICEKEYGPGFELHHIDEDRNNNDLSNLMWLCNSCHKFEHYKNGRTKRYEKGAPSIKEKIISIKSVGIKEVFDVEMEAPNHNFVVGSGIITCNSHAVSYARITCITAYLKAKYPVEFMAAQMIVSAGKKEKILAHVMESRRMGIPVLPPIAGISKYDFSISRESDPGIGHSSGYQYDLKYGCAEDEINCIRFGTSSISYISEEVKRFLVNVRTITDLPFDMFNTRGMTHIVGSGFFDFIDKRDVLLGNIDTIMNFGRTFFVGESVGQYRFFQNKLKLDATKAIPENQVSEIEKDSLGSWVKFHPTDIAGFFEFTTTDVSEIVESEYEMDTATFIAVSTSVNSFPQKDGKMMAIVELSDARNTIQGYIFSNLWDSVQHTVEEGKLYVISGRVSYKKEYPSIIIDLITDSITQAKRNEFKIMGDYDDVIDFLVSNSSGGKSIAHIFNEDGFFLEKIETGFVSEKILNSSNFKVIVR